MLKGLAVYIIGSLGCYFSSNIQMLIISRFIQAFGAAAGSVVTQTIIRDSFKGEKSSMVFAKITGAMAFSPAIGPLLGGFISYSYGYKIIFLFLIILGLLTRRDDGFVI